MKTELPNQKVKVQMVCQFGSPVRGLSPYADALKQALDQIHTVEIDPIDYHSAYPSFLHPAVAEKARTQGTLSWYNPMSWFRVASCPSDIMHIQHWAPPLSVYLWPLAHMAKRHGKKIVITTHNPKPHESRNFFSYFEKKLLRTADKLIVHSHPGAVHLEETIATEGQSIHRISHGMDALASPAQRSRNDYIKSGLDPETRYILLFGNLRGYKGVETLLAAWREIESLHTDTQLIIAGRLWDGKSGKLSRIVAKLLGTAPNASHLRSNLSDTRTHARVILKEGFQSDTDIDALIRIADFCVFPYIRFSGQSGAACRAAGMGCPVLTSQVGALPELAIDETWTSPPADIAQLAERIHQKLGGIQSLAVARAQQLEIAHQSSWDVIATGHAAIYESLK